MSRRRELVLLGMFLSLAYGSVSSLRAEWEYKVVPPALRTATGQMVSPLEFPPAASEQRLWACLVSCDPIQRRGVLRLEERDRMIEFTLHPAAPLFYRGAPAALRDFPAGTMVEIWGYGDEKTDLPRNVLRMSDSFSVMAFSDMAYKVSEVDLSKRTFKAMPMKIERSAAAAYRPRFSVEGQIALTPPEDGWKAVEFSFDDQAKWYLKNAIVDPSHLVVGQTIQANFIRRFFVGPPLITRCTEVWLDEESQDLASLQQLKSFTAYLRDRGFPLRVDSMDDANKVLRVTLLETGLNELYKEWKVGEKHDLSASTTSLQMWEPNGGQSVPDRMFGVTLSELEEVPIGYGCGGARLTFQVPMLYEAYRAGTIIKLYPAGHAVPILPIEERLPKEFDTYLRPQ